MANDPIIAPNWYVVSEGDGYYTPYVMNLVVYEMLVDPARVPYTHWQPPIPMGVIEHVRLRMLLHAGLPLPPSFQVFDVVD